MRLFVGLGNPGSKYESTRHNIGFLVANELAKKLGVNWKTKKRWKAEVAEAVVNGEKIVLVKPQAFMNRSGEAVQAARGWLRKIPVENIWIVHDDVDLPLGKIRIKQGGGSAGHRGVDSITNMLGSNNFWRVRIGIGRPDNPNVPLEEYVLNNFSADEMKQVKTITNEAQEVIINKINAQ